MVIRFNQWANVESLFFLEVMRDTRRAEMKNVKIEYQRVGWVSNSTPHIKKDVLYINDFSTGVTSPWRGSCREMVPSGNCHTILPLMQ